MSLESDLATVLAQLEMMSHVSAVNLNGSARDSGEDIGGRRPPGGVDGREDRHRLAPGEDIEGLRVLRSASHFRRELARGRNRVTLLAEAEASLAAWRRAPRPPSNPHPMPGDFNWKRWVADSELSDVEIARKCSVKRQYVSRVRAAYRERTGV